MDGVAQREHRRGAAGAGGGESSGVGVHASGRWDSPLGRRGDDAGLPAAPQDPAAQGLL